MADTAPRLLAGPKDNGRKKLRARPALVVVAVIIGWFALVYLLGGITRWAGARPGPGAQSSLEIASPDPWLPSGAFGGYTRFTADELNRIKQGHDLRSIRHVPADQASTGPSVVSVNPIDDFTWGAAALSDETGRCYLTLVAHEHQRPEFGGTYYGWLAKNEPCVGAKAVPDRVTSSDWPDAGQDSSSPFVGLLFGLFLLAPIAAALGWAATDVRRRDHPGRSALRWLLPLLIFVAAWWVGGAAIVGAVDNSWNQLDSRSWVGSLAWCLVGGAVPGAAALVFWTCRYRRMPNEKVLAWSSGALLILGIPIAFIVIAGSII